MSMWGYLGYGEKEEDPVDESSLESNLAMRECVERARLAQEGFALPTIALLYERDRNKKEQIANFMQQYTLLLEFQRCYDLLPSGMYLSPSTNSIFTWHGCIFLRQGPYKGGIFKFQMDLPEEYPDYPPSLHFITNVFHPLVEPKSGRVDIDVWFLDWKPNSDYATCVLPRLHKALVHREHLLGPSDAIEPSNPEAYALLKNDPTRFEERAQECAAQSNKDKDVYENPEGALLCFAECPAENHADLLKALQETVIPSATFEDRKCMFVEWFCDYYVRHRILKPKKKKKKRKDRGNYNEKEKGPTMKDAEALKRFAKEVAAQQDDDEDDDEDETEDEKK